MRVPNTDKNHVLGHCREAKTGLACAAHSTSSASLAATWINGFGLTVCGQLNMALISSGWLPTCRNGQNSDERNHVVTNRAATRGAFVREESEVAEFIVVHGQFHQPVIINTGAIAVARTKTESNGSKRLEIVMTSGISVTTEMTIEDLTKRLGATPA